jgi:hypothetical protein
MRRFFVLAFALALGLGTTSRAAIFINEDFAYGDGDLTTVSGGFWAAAANGAGVTPVQVLDGKAIVKFDATEDVSRYTGGPELAAGDTWYYGIQFSIADVREEGLGFPTDYFAHFKDAGPANLRGRLYMTPGTVAGTYTLGITSSSGTLTQKWATDLQFDTTYTAIVSYTASLNDPRAEIPVNPSDPFDGSGNMPNPDPQPLSGMDGWASLWVNPANFSSTKITDTAPATNVGNDLRSGMDSIALRQANTSIAGTPPLFEISVDTFVLGDDFDDVLALVGGGSPGQPGDFDGDGDVDGRDFLVWQRGDSPNSLSAGDLSDWQSNYGVGALAAFSAIPEPGSLCLMAVGFAGLLMRKRR